jgi:hypothetical protein
MTEYKLSRGNLKKRHDGDWYLSLTVVGWPKCVVFTTFKASSGLNETRVVLKDVKHPKKSQESLACSFHEQSWFPACPWHTDEDIEKGNFNCRRGHAKVVDCSLRFL